MPAPQARLRAGPSSLIDPGPRRSPGQPRPRPAARLRRSCSKRLRTRSSWSIAGRGPLPRVSRDRPSHPPPSRPRNGRRPPVGICRHRQLLDRQSVGRRGRLNGSWLKIQLSSRLRKSLLGRALDQTRRLVVQPISRPALRRELRQGRRRPPAASRRPNPLRQRRSRKVALPRCRSAPRLLRAAKSRLAPRH